MEKTVERRKFLKWVGLTAFLSPFAHLMASPNSNLKMATNLTPKELVAQLVRQNDLSIPELLKNQEQRLSHRWFGGLKKSFGIHTAIGTANFIRFLTCALVSPESQYYKSAKLIKSLEQAAQYLIKTQNSDGTIDLYSTNFHSTPDTGFVIEHLCLALTVLNQSTSPHLSRLKADLKIFILKAGDALTIGGIHTPNHRWVVCMALARIYALFPKNKYVQRINKWLNEKIDIDPDGQYTEKSTLTYTPLTNRCLITIARLLNKPELYEPVRKNLEMTLFYVHPDGEVVTEASGRQDKYQRGSMARYYYSYRYLALMDRNGRFAAMAAKIQKTALAQLTETLIYFLESRTLANKLPSPEKLPQDYVKVFPHSDLVRVRHNQLDATILAKNPIFFTFQKGSAVLTGLRLATAFFGKGQFQGERLEIEAGKYILRQKLNGPYYQPMPAEHLSADGNWHKMPRSFRPKSEIQQFEVVATIYEANKGFEIQFNIQGTDNVPFAIELGFRHGGQLKGVQPVMHAPDSYVLENGFGQYLFEDQIIEFGPGQAEHTWTQLRGALPKLNGMSVYLTGYTPLEMTLKIN